MRMTTAKISIAISVGLLLFGSARLSGQEMPDEIEIENSGYPADRKGAVIFTHMMHAEDYFIDCLECHHRYEDGENVWMEGDPVDKCITCHSPLKSEEKAKNLRLAFHNNCKGCHRKMVKDEIAEDAPYMKCRECHATD